LLTTTKDGALSWARSLLHLDARHHTEAQIAAKKAKAAKAGKREAEAHHTEAQIAAKKAKAAKGAREAEPEAHHTEVYDLW